MTFIGVVSPKNAMLEIKQKLRKCLSIKYDLININSENMKNMKNVTFETVLVLDVEELGTNLEELKQILKKSKYILINTDIKENLQVLENLNANVITFGFNNKSTITASSVEEENALICVQRNIVNNMKQEIEPQEIKIKLKNKNNIYSIMGIIGIILVYNNKNLEKFNKI